MQMGLLWFDNDPRRDLALKVQDAANRYREKFGSTPNACYVNQGELTGTDLVVALGGKPGQTLRVMPARNVLPHHFWVGFEEAATGRS